MKLLVGGGQVGGAAWTTAEWSDELNQFFSFLNNWRTNADAPNAAPMPFTDRAIVGERTPCLEGNLDVLYRVLAKRGFRYDASHTARLGTWPTRRLGLWSVPLLELPFIGHTFPVVSMDYNFWANQFGEPAARIENETYRTFWNAFRAILKPA